MNNLSRETMADQRACDARQAAERKPDIAWIEWAMETRHGFKAPRGAELRVTEGVAQYVIVHRARERYVPVYGPRGGRKGWTREETPVREEPIGPALVVPDHCRRVKRLDVWIALHQAGAPEAVRDEFANSTRAYSDIFAIIRGKLPKEGDAALVDLLARPARLLAACEAEIQRLAEVREEHRLANARPVREMWERDLAAGRAEMNMSVSAQADATAFDMGEGIRLPLMLDRRNKWLALARQAKNLGYGADLVAECVLFAREFHDYATSRRNVVLLRRAA